MADKLSTGAASKLWVGTLDLDPEISDFTVLTAGYALEFTQCSLGKQGTVLDASEAGMRGTRSRQNNRTLEGNYVVGGSFTINPSPNDLDALLTMIMGGTESTGDVFNLTEALPVFSASVRYGDATEGTGVTNSYIGLMVSRATFRGSAGGFLELEMECVGLTSVEDAVDPTDTLGTGTGDQPYIMSDSVTGFDLKTVDNLEVKSFELVIDNVIESRSVNSQTVTKNIPTDRIVSLSVTTPWTSVEQPMLGIDTAGSIPGDTEATIRFQHALNSHSLTFQFGQLVAPQEFPSINDKGELDLVTNHIARHDGSRLELVITNDNTA